MYALPGDLLEKCCSTYNTFVNSFRINHKLEKIFKSEFSVSF